MQSISKESIDFPILNGMKPEDGLDYPPRIRLKFIPPKDQIRPTECKIRFFGLTENHSFNLHFEGNGRFSYLQYFHIPWQNVLKH